MDAEFRFQPISFSWVAVHPKPKGVVQFIGGAFFGTFPTLFYRYFLRTVFEEGYTIIALPFRFTFRHWSIAVSLLREQAVLADEISKIAQKSNYKIDIYQDKEKYFWLGHSLGCKYVSLLEFLSSDRWAEILQECGGQDEIQRIEDSLKDVPPDRRSIKGQPSLVIAPDISDTQSAIPKPLAFVAHFLDRYNLGVIPTRKQTQGFIAKSDLFNLTALISFDKDTIAGSETDRNKDEETRTNSDVLWMTEYLKQKTFPILHQEMPGKHLEPIGIQVGDSIVDLNPLDKFIEPISSRRLEYFTIQFLEKLSQRKEQLSSSQSPDNWTRSSTMDKHHLSPIC